MQPETGPIVLFDGVCNLCNGTVQFLIKRDRKKKLRYASLQGAFGQKTLRDFGLNATAPASFIFLDGAKIYTHSTGALRVLSHLGGFWKVLSWLKIVPRFIRDGVYTFIARNRYRWFGTRESCYLPTKDLADRFIE